jgi:predicted AlkP superfamily pyrophosphatase or phosphodiesterase
MRLTCSYLGLVGLLLLAVAAPSAERQSADRHVVLISVDGLAAYLLDDPKAPLPTIRKLAREGTVVDGGMRVSNPSVTWPNHTTLVTGVRPEKHGVLANGVLVRGAPGAPVFVDPKKDKDDLVRVPTLFDRAHAAGLTTADVNWPCTRASKALDDSLPDAPEQITHMTPRLRDDLLRLGLLADTSDKGFLALTGAGRDYVWTEAACHILRERKPNLLVLHLLNVDSTHHAEGAQSPPGYTANAYADMCVSRVVAALEEAGLRERTTIFIVADHGFTLTPKGVCPNVVLRQQGYLKVTANKISEAQVHVVPEGGVGLVYCTTPGQVDLAKVERLLAELEGVAEVVRPERFSEFGLPHPREYSQAPDLLLVAKDGYAIAGTATGEAAVAAGTEARVSAGSHGFVSTLKKMNALCVLSGRGVRRGAHLPEIENIDIAPTIAQILGLANFPADGKVLTAALASSQP